MKVLIAGSGIGGLATALSLHAVGIEFECSNRRRRLAKSALASTCCRLPCYAERKAIVRGYSSLAGYAKDHVNARCGPAHSAPSFAS